MITKAAIGTPRATPATCITEIGPEPDRYGHVGATAEGGPGKDPSGRRYSDGPVRVGDHRPGVTLVKAGPHGERAPLSGPLASNWRFHPPRRRQPRREGPGRKKASHLWLAADHQHPALTGPHRIDKATKARSARWTGPSGGPRALAAGSVWPSALGQPLIRFIQLSAPARVTRTGACPAFAAMIVLRLGKAAPMGQSGRWWVAGLVT
jgi:hypothetical protein